MCNRDPNEAREKLLGYIGESYFRECGGELLKTQCQRAVVLEC